MQGHNRAGLSWDGPVIDNAAQEMQKWIKNSMRLTFACHCCSQNLFCQLFILHPHLWVGEDGEGMEQGFSVAGQDLLFALIRLILLSDLFLNTLLLLQNASLRSQVVRRESGHMGIFPKQYLRSATDDWMMEKIKHSISKHTLWRTDYSEPSVSTEGSRVWKPLIKGNLVEKFPPKGNYNLTTSLRCHISLHPHHSDFALYITRITHIHIAHHSPRVMWWDVASQISITFHRTHVTFRARRSLWWYWMAIFMAGAISIILGFYFSWRADFFFWWAGGIFGDIRMLIK